MIIGTFFTNNGALASGLSPTINIVNVATGSLVVSAASMIALSQMTHAYTYDFTDYDDDVNWAITVDGGATLNDQDRYKFAGNENKGLEFISDIEGGGWNRTGTQQIFTKPDNSTEVARFNLFKADGTPAQETDIEVHKRERV